MEEIKAYKISTGEIFDDKDKAIDAEKMLHLKKKCLNLLTAMVSMRK